MTKGRIDPFDTVYRIEIELVSGRKIEKTGTVKDMNEILNKYGSAVTEVRLKKVQNMKDIELS